MKAKTLFLAAIVLFISGLMLPHASRAQNIGCGSSHSLFICNDSTVMAWGLNGSGQLGDGTQNNSTVPVQVSGLGSMIAVAGGEQHSLALKHDGTVWAWGDNGDGQLGIGNLFPQLSPVPVPNLSNVIAIAARFNHSLALKSDGTVWAWGNNSFGQLGDSTTVSSSVPVQVHSLTGVTAISAGQFHSIALKNDSTVWGWGSNTQGQLGNNSTTNDSVPVQVNGFTSAKAIAAGGFHTLALKSDGSLWAWGFNGFGQLGNGTNANESIPTLVSAPPNITAIAGGWMYSLAVQGSNLAYAWGQGTAGQLGSGNNSNSTLPVQVSGLTNVTHLVGGQIHSHAVQTDGRVRTWGTNTDGELGDGTNTSRLSPTNVVGLCPTVTAAPDPSFTGYFSPTTSGVNKWIAGELATSLSLPNGKTMWLFGRSHIDDIDVNNSIPCAQQEVDNCLLLQDGTVLSNPTTYLDTTVGQSNRSFFKLSPTDSTVLKPGHGYVRADTAFIFLSRWDSNQVFLGNYSARIGITTTDILDITRCIPNTFIDFGKAVLTDSNFVYLYGSKEDSLSIRRPFLARRNFANTVAAWQYYAAPGWTTDTALARPISPYEVAESFSVLRIQGRYFMITQNKAPNPSTCGIQRNILVYHSDSLTGVFDDPALLYTTDNIFQNLPILTFNAYAHPAPAQCDSMLLSYDVQDPGDTLGTTRCPSQCWSTSRQNADTWRPKFIRVPYSLIDTSLSTSAVASFTATNIGTNSWVFVNTSAFATSYFWDFGDGVTSTLQHPSHTYTIGGHYTVTLTAFGCGSSDTSSPFVSFPDPDFPFPNLAVFPNPSHGQFRISAQDLGQSAVTIEVFTVVGNRILREMHQPIGGRLDVQIGLEVAEGIYLLRFGNGAGVVTRKVVVR
jgi:alpha-tubulin suppressor-like RCC1 family protein